MTWTRAGLAGGGGPGQSPASALLGRLEAEQDRWFLWVPVLFGLGIAIYFALPVEPPWLVVSALPLVAMLAALTWRRGVAALLVTHALLALTAGLAVTKLRASVVAAPVLEGQSAPATVTGWIELIEPRPQKGQRVTLRVTSMEGRDPARTPFRVRVRLLAPSAALILEHDGDGRRVEDVLSGRAFRCDGVGCTARVKARLVAVTTSPATLADDCAMATVVIALGNDPPGSGPGSCPPGPFTIAASALRRQGAHAVRLGAGNFAKTRKGDAAGDRAASGGTGASEIDGTGPPQVSVTTVADLRGDRPWTRTDLGNAKAINRDVWRASGARAADGRDDQRSQPSPPTTPRRPDVDDDP